EDLELVGVFSRRDPESITTVSQTTQVFSVAELQSFVDLVDVLVLCGGSKSDLPVQSPELAARFTIVDSFDTHPKIPEQFERVDAAARAAGTIAVMSTGWDPGLF